MRLALVEKGIEQQVNILASESDSGCRLMMVGEDSEDSEDSEEDNEEEWQDEGGGGLNGVLFYDLAPTHHRRLA